MSNNIEEDIKILKNITRLKLAMGFDEQTRTLQAIENTANAYLCEKARADKLEKEYSKMLTKLDEYEED